MKNFLRFLTEDGGQDLIEYAFLAAFIAIVATVGLSSLGSQLNIKFSDISAQVAAGS